MKADIDLLADGITELEKSGVLTSRMLHELANCLSVLAGNVRLAEPGKGDPNKLASALVSVKWASDAMGEIVERYGGFRRQLQNSAAPCALAELIACTRSEVAALAGKFATPGWNWSVTPPANMEAQLRLEPRWIGAAVREIVQLSRSQTGELLFYRSGTSFDSRGLRFNRGLSSSREQLHLLIRWQHPTPTISDTDLHKPPTINLAVAIGILRWVLGQVNSAFLPPEENRFWITLPLV